MKIEKTKYSYQVTECDLKFGKQITLDGELLISASILDKVRAEIERQEKWLDCAGYNAYNIDIVFNAIKLALTRANMSEE